MEVNTKIYGNLLKFKKEDLAKIQPNYFWDPRPNEGIKYYAKGFHDEDKPLEKVAHLSLKSNERFLDMMFYQREEDVKKPYILGKDEYYVEVLLSSMKDEEEQKDNNKFYSEDIIIKKIKKTSDIYNITNLCEEFSYELGKDLFKTLNMENDTYGDGEANLVERLINVLNNRKNSDVGNELLCEWTILLTYNGSSFIYYENDTER